MKKKEISKILTDTTGDRKWISVKDKLPEPDQRVYIRFQNKQFVYAEDDKSIYYSEDLKLAKCVRDYNDPDNMEKCSWVIEPPYLKYDFSPLSQKDKLLQGSIVTHWSESTEEERDTWDNQDKPFGTYTKLRIEVDDQNEELMYKAIYHGVSTLGQYLMAIQAKFQEDINRAAAQGNVKAVHDLKDAMDKEVNEIMMYHELLYDLQRCIDYNMMIEDGVPVKLHDYGNPEEEDGLTDEIDTVVDMAYKEKTINALTQFTLNIKPVLWKLTNSNLHAEAETMNSCIRNLFIGLGLEDPMREIPNKEENKNE